MKSNLRKQVPRDWGVFILVLLVATTLGILAFHSKVYTWPFTDPKGSLLSGQALLETGSINLKPYEAELDSYEWQVFRTKDKILYAYPLGNTLMHLPLIWVATKAGFDLTDHEQEAELNRLFAAFSLMLTFILTYALFRRRSGYLTSLLFSAVIVLGSSIFSTMGLALWNLNYAVVFSLAIILILDSPKLMENKDTGWIIGIILFLGFIVRPSFALLVLVAFGYLISFHRIQFLRAAMISALLLLLYILFSLGTFGTLLPGHYQVQDFSAIRKLAPNLVAQFISPSRGFLVFSPVFLLTFVGAFLFNGKSGKSPVHGAVCLWLFLQLLFLSSWFMWWGGGGYGNRLFTETMPAWIYLSAVYWPAFLNHVETPVKKLLFWGSLTVLALISAYIHVVQGANNQWTVTWHQKPNKDQNPEYFWNYRFPQFLASENQIANMLEWHRMQILLKRGVQFQTIPVEDPSLVFNGWHALEGKETKLRWSSDKIATINIPSERLSLPTKTSPSWYVLGIEGRTFMGQKIEIYVNNVRVGRIQTDRKSPPNTYITESFTLKKGGDLEIQLRIEDPKIPAEELKGYSLDRRELGLGLFKLHLFREPTPGEMSGN